MIVENLIGHPHEKGTVGSALLVQTEKGLITVLLLLLLLLLQRERIMTIRSLLCNYPSCIAVAIA